jgi:predicted DNA-binding transcriptional regulator YafY
VQLLNKYYRMLIFALYSPEEWVVQVWYIDRKGNVTKRPVSPYRLERDHAKVYCLGRDAIRRLNYERILRVQLRHASTVLTPEAIVSLVDHRRRLRAG